LTDSEKERSRERRIGRIRKFREMWISTVGGWNREKMSTMIREILEEMTIGGFQARIGMRDDDRDEDMEELKVPERVRERVLAKDDDNIVPSDLDKEEVKASDRFLQREMDKENERDVERFSCRNKRREDSSGTERDSDDNAILRLASNDEASEVPNDARAF
jgi:hypothetical protein